MTTTRVETLPATWDDARDLPFFRITHHVLPPDLCFGASVLLASYDDAPGTQATAAATERRTVTATSASTDTRTQPERGLTPAPVRHPR